MDALLCARRNEETLTDTTIILKGQLLQDLEDNSEEAGSPSSALAVADHRVAASSCTSMLTSVLEECSALWSQCSTHTQVGRSTQCPGQEWRAAAMPMWNWK